MKHPSAPCFKVRSSGIHGKGAFATRRIRKGTRIIEYTGERISHEEADRRYAKKAEEHHHTFHFAVDKHTVIDAGRHGNDARFINHSCDPNTESVHEDGRIYIEAIRNIQPGIELAYDYGLTGSEPRTKAERAHHACRCGSPDCRGSMHRTSSKRGKKRSATRTESSSR